MNQTVRTKKIIGTVLIAVLALVMLIPVFYTLQIGTSYFDARLGVFGSPKVGMENVNTFKASPEYHEVMSNTFEISALGAGIGVVYVFLLSMAIGSVKDRFFKAILAVLFAIPTVSPVRVFYSIFPGEVLLSSPELMKQCVAVMDGLRLAGLFSLVALFIRGDVLKESGKCVLIFIAVKLALVLTMDMTTMFQVDNSGYGDVQSLVRLAYNRGMRGGEYSHVAATDMIRLGYQLLAGIVGCLILMLIYGEFKKSNQNCLRTDVQCVSNTPKGLKLFTVATIIPILILIFAITNGASLIPDVRDPKFEAGFQLEWKMALESALWVSVISFLFAMAARNAFKGVGFIILMLLLATGNNLIGNYVLAHDLGMLDTVKGMAFYNLQMIPVISLLMTCATYKDRNWKKDIVVFLGGFVLMFGYFWGDFAGSLIMNVKPELHTLSYHLLGLTRLELTSASAIPYIPNSTLLYIIIPVAAVAVGMLGCAFLNYNKKKPIPAAFEQTPSFDSQQPLYPNQQPVYAGQPTVMPQQVGVSPQEDIVEPKPEPVENSTTPLQ